MPNGENQTPTGVYIWGGVLTYIAVWIFISGLFVLRDCYAVDGCEGASGVGCDTNFAAMLYLILKEWGTGIGALGAGAGLAWATFYNSHKGSEELAAVKQDLEAIRGKLQV